jgi:hypothetical protein
VENEERVVENSIEGATLYIKTEQGNGFVMEYRLTVEDGGSRRS